MAVASTNMGSGSGCDLRLPLWLATIPLLVSSQEAPGSAGEAEFFEKRIRPILVSRCYECHSTRAEKLKGGLRADSIAGLLRGGDTGPAIVRGKAPESLLITAVKYERKDLQMPPKHRLSAAEVSDLTEWINRGAVWPADGRRTASVAESGGFDLQKRRAEHWAWQPVKPPPIPKVTATSWVQTPIDAFILAGLETAGLRPAPTAEQHTLLRRVTFDLTGLPPTPADLSSFLADRSGRAFENVVERLLASPQFGERWARHWFDRVRYAETMGHEFDYPILQPWRYRDYVIRAFNADLPYDQFVREHIAGDLLPTPRTHPTEGWNESLIGTAFWWFVQQVHAPVDIRQAQAEVIDNQIDVLTKAFLGLTVSCARCHDHKFDAISTKDFYSLYGVLSSSRYTAGLVNSDSMRQAAEPLRGLKSKLAAALVPAWRNAAQELEAGLMKHRPGSPNEGPLAKLLEAAHSRGAAHPFHAWLRAGGAGDSERVPADAGSVSSYPEGFFDARTWTRSGPAFSQRDAGNFLFSGGEAQPVAAFIGPEEEHSARVSVELEGELRSPTFVIADRFLHVRMSGREARLRLVMENFTLIRPPIYGGLQHPVDSEVPRWFTFDLGMWPGRRAYVEVADSSAADPAGERASGKKRGVAGGAGFASVSGVRVSNAADSPADAAWPAKSELSDATGPQALAGAYQRAVVEALEAWGRGQITGAQAALLNALREAGYFSPVTSPDISALIQSMRGVEGEIPEPKVVAAMTDGTGLDEPVFVRGNHRSPGPEAQRRFLEAVPGVGSSPFKHGSGRLELAREMASRENPFTARVMANFIWQHLFGRGVVATVDNFGVLGEAPSHPELLDWLATEFLREGWSVKKLIRTMVMSRAYQMSSAARDTFAEAQNPGNRLWHRANLRRLEGEAIRDAMLSVAGMMRPEQFGPPVPIHLTPFMDGRGRPAQSGPLDGAGRRSVYLEVRRNFLPPLLLAFDTPIPASPAGRRAVSNVPAQALILMNDPFVAQQAGQWASRLLTEESRSDTARLERAYLAALARAPSPAEVTAALEFLAQQSVAAGSAGDSRAAAWADFCHVLFNLKEFVYLN